MTSLTFFSLFEGLISKNCHIEVLGLKLGVQDMNLVGGTIQPIIQFKYKCMETFTILIKIE